MMQDRYANRAVRGGHAHHESDDPSRVCTSEWVPPVDIRVVDEGIELIADLPGVAPESIELLADRGLLTIKGERTARSDNSGVVLNEISCGRFHRRFQLPDEADIEAISARTVNGVLTVLIPKRAASGARRVDIQ